MPYWFFMFHLLEKRIAEAFAAEGMQLSICARGEAQLSRTAEAIARETGATVHATAADVAHTDGIARVTQAHLDEIRSRMPAGKVFGR